MHLHWFWRAAIAVVCGVFSLALSLFGCLGALVGIEPYIGVVIALGMVIGSYSICIIVYDGLTRQREPNYGDKETRCRKCGYILRGITEPKCSECGERI